MRIELPDAVFVCDVVTHESPDRDWEKDEFEFTVMIGDVEIFNKKYVRNSLDHRSYTVYDDDDALEAGKEAFALRLKEVLDAPPTP